MKYIDFNFKINVKMAVVINKDIKEVQKNIQLRFMDGCRFIASSLNRLASSLDDDQCKKLRDFYKGEEILKLMKSKVQVKLPPKNIFYSNLNTKGISDQDYEHAQ